MNRQPPRLGNNQLRKKKKLDILKNSRVFSFFQTTIKRRRNNLGNFGFLLLSNKHRVDSRKEEDSVCVQVVVFFQGRRKK